MSNTQGSSTKAWRVCTAVGGVASAAVVLLSSCGDRGPVEPNAGTPLIDEIFSFEATIDIEYGRARDEFGQLQALHLNLYEPKRDGAGLRPAIIWLHGGGFTSGRRDEFTEYAERFAKRGYVAATVEYRLREGGDFSYIDLSDSLGQMAKRDAQHDAQAAVRWLRANAERFRINSDQIIVAGYSAGAVAALRVGFLPDDPGESGNPGYTSKAFAAVGISGMVDTTLINPNGTPTLLVHGENDRSTPIEFPRAVCKIALANGVPCELEILPGVGHFNIRSQEKHVVIPRIARFLKEQIDR